MFWKKKNESPQQQQGRLREESQRKAMAERGVLVPPWFGVGARGTPLPLAAVPPLSMHSTMAHLQATDDSHRIVHDHMEPGVWLGTGIFQRQQQQLESTSSSSHTNNNYTSDTRTHWTGKRGGLIVTAQPTPQITLQLQANANNSKDNNGNHESNTSGDASMLQSPPLALVADYRNQHGMGLQAQWNPGSSTGRLGGSLSASRSIFQNKQQPHEETLDLQLGASVPFELPFNNNEKPCSGDKRRLPNQPWYQPSTLTGFGAASFLGATLAVESQVPLLGQAPTMSTTSYFSMDLNGNASSSDNPNTSAAPPPTQLTMQAGPHQRVIALSQLLTFDRMQFNPAEDRAPKVRNTIGWTVRFEQKQNAATSTASDNSSDSHSTTQQLVLGGAWQINRGLCVKAVMRPEHVTTGIILKRWAEPRITCSLLHRFPIIGSSNNNSANNTGSGGSPATRFFWGIHLELEAGGSGQSDVYSGNGSAAYPPMGHYLGGGGSTAGVPETKATLPDKS